MSDECVHPFSINKDNNSLSFRDIAMSNGVESLIIVLSMFFCACRTSILEHFLAKYFTTSIELYFVAQRKVSI